MEGSAERTDLGREEESLGQYVRVNEALLVKYSRTKIGTPPVPDLRMSRNTRNPETDRLCDL